jgi:iron complex transport system permease protein
LRSAWAEPYLLGLSSWSGLALLIVQILGSSVGFLYHYGVRELSKIVAVFIGAGISLSLLAFCQFALKKRKDLFFLVGFTSNALSSALTTLLIQVIDRWQAFEYQTWFFGYVNLTTPTTLVLSYLLGFYLMKNLFKFLPKIIVFSVQETQGPLNLDQFKILVFLASLTGLSILLIGSVGFVGILIPAFLHPIPWRSLKEKWWACYILGGSLYGWAHWLGQIIYPPYEFNASVVIALCLGPFFLIKLFKAPTPPQSF